MTVLAPPAGAEAAAGRGPGRHRRGLRWSAGLLAALAAGATLLALPPAERATPPGPLTLRQAWPGATIRPLPAAVPDGPAFNPMYVLDATTSVGTAPSQDGRRLRLLLRAGTAAPRELRSLPMSTEPVFGGVTAAGDLLAWAESTAEGAGPAVTRIWTVNWRAARPPRLLTADTGAVAFFNSQYDLLIAAGRVRWVAVGPSEAPVTEIRSVPVGGGPVTVRAERGPWALSAHPWLVSAVTEQAGQVQLRDLAANKRRTVPAGPTELVTCSPAWCRVQVLAGDGPTRLDLMRPDGADRRRVAGGDQIASVIDVAVLDRFEVLTRTGPQGPAVTSQDLLLYDVRAKRTAVVAAGVGQVVSRAGWLWWSTGEEEQLRWQALDLRTLVD